MHFNTEVWHTHIYIYICTFIMKLNIFMYFYTEIEQNFLRFNPILFTFLPENNSNMMIQLLNSIPVIGIPL